jgi:hypothetical protein
MASPISILWKLIATDLPSLTHPYAPSLTYSSSVLRDWIGWDLLATKALSLLLFTSVKHWCLFSLLCWQSDSIVVRLERTFCFHLFIAGSVYLFFDCFRSVEICRFRCFGFTSHTSIFMIDFGRIAISPPFFRIDVGLSK